MLVKIHFPAFVHLVVSHDFFTQLMKLVPSSHPNQEVHAVHPALRIPLLMLYIIVVYAYHVLQ